VNTIFLPFLKKLCERTPLKDKDDVVMMDKCSSHRSPEILKLMAENRLKVLTFAPHTKRIFQGLDMSLFGAFKRKKQFQLPFDNIDGRHLVIRKVWHVYKQTMIADTIRNAFMMLEYEFDIQSNPYRLNADP
jgi:hypothetical protein